MELIRISDRKLKIMLTPKDMRHFELNLDTVGEDSAEMHRAFRLLLEEIKKQTGFETDDNHLTVQYFPSREGGCEMFISSIAAAKDASAQEAIANAFEGKALQRHPSETTGGFHREYAYRFEQLDHLLKVCQRLDRTDYKGIGSAFRDHRNNWYLLLNISTDSPFTMPKELDFIAEYGHMADPLFLKLYISEHGKTICRDNAIRLLGTLK